MDDQQAISAVLTGDVNAFAVLVERYQKPIYNLMYRMTGSQADALDVAEVIRAAGGWPRLVDAHYYADLSEVPPLDDERDDDLAARGPLADDALDLDVPGPRPGPGLLLREGRRHGRGHLRDEEPALPDPDHDPQFRVAVDLPGLAPAEGVGGSKRAAEKVAASVMIAREGVGGSHNDG